MRLIFRRAQARVLECIRGDVEVAEAAEAAEAARAAEAEAMEAVEAAEGGGRWRRRFWLFGRLKFSGGVWVFMGMYSWT